MIGIEAVRGATSTVATLMASAYAKCGPTLFIKPKQHTVDFFIQGGVPSVK
jgi:hypothetical protein